MPNLPTEVPVAGSEQLNAPKPVVATENSHQPAISPRAQELKQAAQDAIQGTVNPDQAFEAIEKIDIGQPVQAESPRGQKVGLMSQVAQGKVKNVETVLDSQKAKDIPTGNSTQTEEGSRKKEENKEQQGERTEEEQWKQLEDLIPVNEKLQESIPKVDFYNRTVLDPWAKNAPVLIQQIQSLWDNRDKEDAVPLPEKLTPDLTSLDQELAPIKAAVAQKDLPSAYFSPQLGLLGKLRMRLDSKFKDGLMETRRQELQQYCNQKTEEAKTAYDEQNNRRYKEEENETQSLSKELTSKIRSLREVFGTFPGGHWENISDVIQSITQLRAKAGALRNFYLATHGDTSQESKTEQRELRVLAESTIQNAYYLREIIKEQAALRVNNCNKVEEYLYGQLGSPGSFEGQSQYGGFSELAVIPSKEQSDRIISFRENAAKLWGIYDQLQPPLYPRQEKDLLAGTRDQRLEKLHQVSGKIRNAVVSHMTPANETYAMNILREGYLINSLGQQALGKRANINSSGAANRGLLQSVAFSVNGVETQYGRQYDQKSSFDYETARKEEDQAVGFVFPYVAVIEGNQFREQGNSSRSNVANAPNELHVLPSNYRSDEAITLENSVVRVDINKGIFIAPETQKEMWVQFLLKPLDQGGAGKDEQWVESHCQFYSADSNPNQFVQKARGKGSFNFPKSILGAPVATGNLDRQASGVKTPLFKWITV